MARCLLLLLLIAGLYLPASAQLRQPQHHDGFASMKTLRGLPSPQAKTTGAYRLRAQSVYRLENGQLLFSDSSSYRYSGGRTSHYMDAFMGYIDDLEGAAWGWPRVDYDSAWFYHSTVGTQPGWFTTSYNAAGKPVFRKFSQYPCQADLLNYTAAGQVRAAYQFYSYTPGPVQDSSWRTLFTYDAQGRMSADSEQMHLSNGDWETVFATWYWYDNAGRLSRKVTAAEVTASFDSNTRTLITYNAAGLPVREDYQYYLGNGYWSTQQIDSTFYNSSQAVRSRAYRRSGSGPFYLMHDARRYYNSAGLTDSIIQLNSPNGIDWDSTAVRAAFDAHGNPVRVDWYEASGPQQALQLFQRNRYYYEYATGLKAGNPQLEPITVHPNPVTDVLSLEVPAGGQYKAELSGADGRLWKQYSFGAAGGLKLNLEVPDLPPGLYSLVIRGQGGAGYRAVFQKR